MLAAGAGGFLCADAAAGAAAAGDGDGGDGSRHCWFGGLWFDCLFGEGGCGSGSGCGEEGLVLVDCVVMMAGIHSGASLVYIYCLLGLCHRCTTNHAGAIVQRHQGSQ